MTPREIGYKLGASAPTVVNRLRKARVKLRSPSEAARLALAKGRRVPPAKFRARVKFSYEIHLTPTESAYLAGIIDGEGSIVFSDNRYHLSVGSTDKLLLDWIYDKVGGTVSLKTPGGYRRKPFYQWVRYEAYIVFQILSFIQPYLIIKKAKAQEAIANLWRKIEPLLEPPDD